MDIFLNRMTYTEDTFKLLSVDDVQIKKTSINQLWKNRKISDIYIFFFPGTLANQYILESILVNRSIVFFWV